MKSWEQKKKLFLKKTTITQLDKKNITEVKNTLQWIKGGDMALPTNFGTTCGLSIII